MISTNVVGVVVDDVVELHVEAVSSLLPELLLLLE